MIKKAKWIETQQLGSCKLRYPVAVKLEKVSDYWVASCCTLSCHAVDAKKKRALHILGDIILQQFVSYRETAPDGNTEDANILLRFLEALIIEEEE